MIRSLLTIALFLFSGPTFAFGAERSDPRFPDWTYWRGPEQNGISRETGIADKWDPRGGPGSNLAWVRRDLGTRSTPVVMNGRLYTIVRDLPGTANEGEAVVCINTETGEDVWRHRFNVWLSEVPDTRVGWSSVVADPETGYVYALGVCGYFCCLDGATGKPIWSIPMHERFGLLSTYGGRTNFPVICEDLVLLGSVIIGWGDMARPAHRVLAMNKRTGEVVWFVSTRLLPEDTIYCAPVVTVLKGQKAMVFGSGDGSIWALQPRTGKTIWEYQFSRRGINTPPVVDGDHIYVGHSEENVKGLKVGAVARIDGSLRGLVTEKAEVWKVEELGIGKCAPLLWDKRLYTFDDAGKLRVLDAETGDPIGTGRPYTTGTMNRSSPLYVDGKIIYTEANGRWYFFQPTEKGVKELSKGRLPAGEEINASPICSHGRLYITSSHGLYCIQDPSKASAADPISPAAEEIVDGDKGPSHVQIVPCEILMGTGETQQLKVRLFNARGQLLGESPASFQLEGDGKISSEGLFTAPTDRKHTATIITAKVGDLTGRARIRIVPPLPWKFDFEGLNDAPLPWVGARYRHQIRNVDGNNLMAKITTIPKGTKSRSWFGPSSLHDYTVQAELYGNIMNKKIPDMGVIAQGYTLELQGEQQKLYMSSWISHDFRTHQEIDFKWEPNTWYVMKLQVANQNGKAVIRGKVWKKGEKEPQDWRIEMVDDTPNTQGSPGLFGNSTNAEVFIDNVTVTPN
ncbi:MAG: serine/threonine protein kinase [Planctomycetes bacterium]|nr:serine/threonine protein kinase [Planctomycetota bacterium]